MIAQAVIGAGYGDEGKGLMVDALAATAGEQPVVVRSNGGAQAGHTVVTPDGRRQVFHHLGSGALAGAATHLSRFFVHHPMLLQAEHGALDRLGGCVEASADPKGLVTTPWDMLLNQAAERARGNSRHGSCGLGFGETVERSGTAFRLTVADLAQPDLAARLERIRRAWFPQRLRVLGVDALMANEAAILADDAVQAVFLEDCARFLDLVKIRPDQTLGDGRPVIFEGAQGLLLDQAIGNFPHVTRSHTGLVNVAAIAREAELEGVDVVYVTRAYATRHGAGPLPGSVGSLEGFKVVDPTNAPNPWQGRIRYAPLDVGRLRGALAADLRLADTSGLTVHAGIAVTCLDQARGPVTVLGDGVVQRSDAADLATFLGARLDLPVLAQSWGPSRTAVDLHKNAPRLAA